MQLRSIVVVPVLVSALSMGAWAQKTYPGCTPLAESDFKITTLITRATDTQMEEPVKMSMDMDASGNIDIYFVQRYGKIRKFNVTTKQITTIGTITVSVALEDGVTGIILDPGFKTNRWLYIYYGRGTAANDFHFRLARFKLDAAGMLDMASEAPILEMLAGKGKSHTGGSMRFDPQGNLYLGIGENEGLELSCGNTNDLRGKILRFKPIAFADGQKPTPGVGSTYTIPAGNLFPVGTAQTRPEIYIMGNRNPYTITLDHRTGRLAWGDIGPNGTDTTEEFDITTTPGNYGYPYWAGNQVVVNPTSGTPAKPINANSGNTGLRELPPARPSVDAYLRSASIAGPIYRYDDAPKNSTVKLPPHLDGMWLLSDYNSSYIDSMALDAATGLKKVGKGHLFRNLRFDRPLDVQQGPDGAIYVVNYAGYFTSVPTTGLVRLEYTGTCRPDPSVSIADQKRLGRAVITAYGFTVEVGDIGPHELRVADMRGRIVAEFRGTGMDHYDLTAAVGQRPGVYAVVVKAPGESLVSRVVLGR